MNRSQLIQSAREETLDDVSDSESTDESLYRYSTRSLIRWLGEGERVACRSGSCRLIYDETTVETCKIVMATGTRSYAISPKVLRLDRVLYDGNTLLDRVTAQDLDERVTGWRDYTPGPLACYFVVGRKLVLDRAPSAVENGKVLMLHVWREPLSAPKENEEPEIPKQYHEDLGHYMVYRAKMKGGLPDDMAVAKLHLDMFRSRFGPENSAAELERKLEGPGSLQHYIGSSVYADNYRRRGSDFTRDWDRF